MSVENTVVRNQRLSDLQVGYLAGIMDGEGTITFVYHKSKTNVNVIHSPVVFLCAVANSNPLIIESVTSLLSILGIKHKVFSPKKEWNKKDVTEMNINFLQFDKTQQANIRAKLHMLHN